MARRVDEMKSSRVKEGSGSTLQPFNLSTLQFTNRQRTKRINRRLLRQITEAVLAKLPKIKSWDLTFHLVSARRISEINETHLGHEGPTDVITFDYNALENPELLCGEIFICIEVAVEQAREFRTTWQSELVRYIIHALLHLCGHDDLAPAPRRQMKQVENRLVRRFSQRFDFAALGC